MTLKKSLSLFLSATCDPLISGNERLTTRDLLAYDLYLEQIRFIGGNMYAIIEVGSKQYRVEKGDVIDVELLKELTGENGVEFSQVLLLNSGENIKVGSPFVEKCIVKGEVMGLIKGPKVIAYKYKRRQNYRRTVGHRQKFSRVKITDIQEITEKQEG